MHPILYSKTSDTVEHHPLIHLATPFRLTEEIAMIQICDNEVCTGCGLCRDLCPQSAITMKPTPPTMHLLPIVDSERCVDCNLCSRKCPSLHEQAAYSPEAVYAAWQINVQKQKGSSSGAVAAALYETAIKQGYEVTGVFLNAPFQAHMVLVDSIEKAQVFRGSKYIQPDTNSVYRDCLDVLWRGKKVLFIGLPCHCAAMRSAAGNNSDNLLTVELVCHGAPSQKMFADYLRWIEHRKGRSAQSVSFRSNYGEELTLSDDRGTFWHRRWQEDDFLYCFQKGLLQNAACLQCRYAKPERSSDLTIGDFWGIGKDLPFSAPSCKVSLVAVFSQKGENLLMACNQLHLERRPYCEALAGNTNLRIPAPPHPERKHFLKVYTRLGIEAAMKATVHYSIQSVHLKSAGLRTLKRTLKYFASPILNIEKGNTPGHE